MADISDIYSFMRKAGPPPFSAAGLAGAHQALARRHRTSAQVVLWMGLSVLVLLALVALFEGHSNPRGGAPASSIEAIGDVRSRSREPDTPGVLPFMAP